MVVCGANAGAGVWGLELRLRGGLEFRGVNGAPRSRYYTDANKIGPRFGFAYSATQKTVFRGGIGIFYGPGLVRLFNAGNPGFSVTPVG